jgi:hypothetical protein
MGRPRLDKPDCSVIGCDRRSECQDLCKMHWSRLQRHGDTDVALRRTTPLMTRFWAKVEKTDGCWLWTGALDGNGYGQITSGRRGSGHLPAHRVAYEFLVGPIPDGMELDHVWERGCRSTACVNPAHLEPVTHRENVLRGNSPMAQQARQTHCKHGHEFTAENTAFYGNDRHCLT